MGGIKAEDRATGEGGRMKAGGESWSVIWNCSDQSQRIQNPQHFLICIYPVLDDRSIFSWTVPFFIDINHALLTDFQLIYSISTNCNVRIRITLKICSCWYIKHFERNMFYTEIQYKMIILHPTCHLVLKSFNKYQVNTQTLAPFSPACPWCFGCKIIILYCISV